MSVVSFFGGGGGQNLEAYHRYLPIPCTFATMHQSRVLRPSGGLTAKHLSSLVEAWLWNLETMNKP